MSTQWIDASEFGANGSIFTANGKIKTDSNELELLNVGDFRHGQWEWHFVSSEE